MMSHMENPFLVFINVPILLSKNVWLVDITSSNTWRSLLPHIEVFVLFNLCSFSSFAVLLWLNFPDDKGCRGLFNMLILSIENMNDFSTNGVENLSVKYESEKRLLLNSKYKINLK